MKKWQIRALVGSALVFGTVTASFAGSTVGLPYEEPGLDIVESLTGVGAFIISALAIVGGVGTIIFANNISDVARWFVIAGIGIGVLVGVIGFLATAFGVTGAEIAAEHLITDYASHVGSASYQANVL